MISLSLERINAKSPYEVFILNGGYEFHTHKGIRYRIKFIEEEQIGGCDTYQFAISKLDNFKSSYDSNISATTFAIIDEFFAEYENVLLYICDTSDNRESGRNRLFMRWFEKAANPNRFTILTAHSIVEGEGIYAAIIVENRNSKLLDITKDFTEAAKALEK